MKIPIGYVGSIPAAKSLLEKVYLSQDCVLMVGKMYLQKEHNFIVRSKLVQMNNGIYDHWF